MQRAEIHSTLTTLLREQFRQPDLEITEATTANEVHGWDSLAHINVVLRVERQFKIKFTTREIRSLADVGALIDVVQKKLG